MNLHLPQWLLGVRTAFLIPFLTGAGVALAQAPNFDPYAAPSSGRAANFASSNLFAEGDAIATASDAPAIDPGSCDSCPRPTWSVATDVMFLDRNPARATLVRTQVNPVEVLNASAFNFNWASGPRVSLMRHDECFDLELTHFDVTGWSAQGSATAPPTIVQVSPPNVGVILSNFSMDWLNISRLFSTEFNVRKAWTPNITALAGFRWVEFYDHLQLDITNIHFRNWITSNRLYGAQIGIDALLLKRNSFELRSVLKTGLYGNAAHSYADIPGSSFQVVVRDSQVAFLGDLACNGTYRLNDCWAVRGGYQLLWLDGLALAPNQTALMDMTLALPSSVQTTNSLFAHGATFGLEANF